MHAAREVGKRQVADVDQRAGLWDVAAPPMPPESTIPTPDAARSPWPRVVLLLGVVVVIAAAVLWALQKVTDTPSATLDKGATLARELGQQAATVARAFREQTVRQEFLSTAASLTGTTRLQVATLQEHETFRRKESDSLAWGVITLPSIVVQADVPVEYGYYLDFNGPWEFAQKDKVVTACAPLIQPSTPAPDISKLTFYTLEGHVWQDDKPVRERLQSSLSAALRDRATEHLSLVREAARRQTQAFVERWLADSYTDGQRFQVKVVFPDERTGPVAAEQKPAPKLPE